ncbi:hypothetical protein M3Y98_00670500 [Aphelenchoides besseyi]|nr:hypothetical protein M3Y98_00670500 [Aphelenchoides besseyi]KAI6209169.1 hypothetical protein M3Y96_00192900 [Aphelenchoides besseyi]
MSTCTAKGPADVRTVNFRWQIDSLLPTFINTTDLALKNNGASGNVWTSDLFVADDRRFYFTVKQEVKSGQLTALRFRLDELDADENSRKVDYRFTGETANHSNIYMEDFHDTPELLLNNDQLQNMMNAKLTFVTCTTQPADLGSPINYEASEKSVQMPIEYVDMSVEPIEFCLPALFVPSSKSAKRESKLMGMSGHKFKIEMTANAQKDYPSNNRFNYTIDLHNSGNLSSDLWLCSAYLEAERGEHKLRSHQTEQILRPFANKSPITIWQSSGYFKDIRSFSDHARLNFRFAFRPICTSNKAEASVDEPVESKVDGDAKPVIEEKKEFDSNNNAAKEKIDATTVEVPETPKKKRNNKKNKKEAQVDQTEVPPITTPTIVEETKLVTQATKVQQLARKKRSNSKVRELPPADEPKKESTAATEKPAAPKKKNKPKNVQPKDLKVDVDLANGSVKLSKEEAKEDSDGRVSRRGEYSDPKESGAGLLKTKEPNGLLSPKSNASVESFEIVPRADESAAAVVEIELNANKIEDKAAVTVDTPTVTTRSSDTKPGPKTSAKFNALLNMWSRFGGKKSTSEDDKKESVELN